MITEGRCTGMLYCVVYKLTLQRGSAQLLYFCTYIFMLI